MSALELLISLLTAVILACTLVGLGVRYALLPWLREHLVVPVTETRRQVSVNKHVSSPPTLLDQVDTIAKAVADAAAAAEEARDEVRVAAGMFEGHIGQSEAAFGEMWKAIHDLQNRKDAGT